MKKKNKIKMYLLLKMFIISCLICTGCTADKEVLFMENESTIEDNPPMEESTVTIELKEEKRIVVHVCGAVRTPGVYELDADSRVQDAVEAAGGFLVEADTEYVNLATVLTDGNKVRIPTKEETTQVSYLEMEDNDNGVMVVQGQQNTEETIVQKININTADKDLLCTLPGIGETRAESIITYRMEQGAFSKIEDIMLVSGIKESSFQKIKEYITIK